MPLDSFPGAVAELLAGRRAEPVLIGESGARVLRFVADDAPTLFLKVAPLVRVAETLRDEAARLRWMAGHGLPVAPVRHYELCGGTEYLVLDAVPGADASVPRRRDAAAGVVAALAAGLRLLHETPAAGCPFVHDAASRVALARERVRAGLVDEGAFDGAWRSRRAARLLDELEATRPADERPVLTHGDYCLPNVILRDAGGRVTLSGLVDCGRAGLADPWQDLALAARSVAWNLGVALVPQLFREYGIAEVDRGRLRFYMLLDEFF